MRLIFFFLIIVLCFACQTKPLEDLPIYGRTKIVDGDTVLHSIPDFEFISQDSVIINNASLQDHIYLADFFFTSCPSICPRVTKQMLRLHDAFKNEAMVKLVSYTIDPKRDDVLKLRQYADKLDVSSEKWLFLTGEKDSLINLADDYFVVAFEDPDAPGGFDHSGKIILVDKGRHIRGYAEGTDPDDVSQLIPVVKQLLNEYKSEE